jgi:hypothetical protein
MAYAKAAQRCITSRPFLDHASAIVGRLSFVLDGMRQGGLGEVTADIILGAPVPWKRISRPLRSTAPVSARPEGPREDAMASAPRPPRWGA